MVADEAGREFRRVEATELTADAVRGLAMVYRSQTRPAPQSDPVVLDRPDADRPIPATIPPAVVQTAVSGGT